MWPELARLRTYFGAWFYQGVFLKDKHDKLINAQEGKTKALAAVENGIGRGHR